MDFRNLPFSIAQHIPGLTRQFDVKGGATQYNPEELKQVGGTIFGELSNVGGLNEARQILSTIMNRAKESGKSLKDIISAPKQYKAYGGKQYQTYLGGKLDYPSQQKANLVNQLLQELSSGKFQPQPNIKFFQHTPQGFKASASFQDTFAKPITKTVRPIAQAPTQLRR